MAYDVLETMSVVILISRGALICSRDNSDGSSLHTEESTILNGCSDILRYAAPVLTSRFNIAGAIPGPCFTPSSCFQMRGKACRIVGQGWRDSVSHSRHPGSVYQDFFMWKPKAGMI